jgi:hypothetical protein
MNRLKLRSLLLVLFSGFFITACQAKEISLVSPTQTPSAPCIDVEFSKPMTENQLEYIGNHAYNFIYVSEEKNIQSVYSLNRVDTVCSEGYPAGNFNVWKVVSGFIVDINQPNKDLYYPGGTNTGGGSFVNIYAKARFISQDGKEHDYWLQLQGNPPGYWFQLVQWNKPISESKNQIELTAMEVLATEKNGDGTNSYIDANTIIPDGLLKVNDQFVAILYAGYTSKDAAFTTSDVMKQFVNALEGEAEFPNAPDGFFLPVQAMIVPSRP